MFALVALMAGCEKAEESVNPETPRGQQEIKLTAGITRMEVTSKAAITEDVFPNGTNVGLYALQEGTDASIWTTGIPKYTNDGTVTITDNKITITDKKLYYPTNDKPMYFIAYHPIGNAGAFSTGTAPSVTFDLSGNDQPDIMYATGVSDILSTQTSSSVVSLNFAHKLAKVAFKVKAGEGFEASGISISTLELKNINTGVTLSVENGNLTFDTPKTISYTPNQEITATASPVFGTTLLEPEATYTLTATAGGLEYTLSGLQTPKAGQAKNIVLTFTGTEIEAMASITKWEDLAEEDKNISK